MAEAEVPNINLPKWPILGPRLPETGVPFSRLVHDRLIHHDDQPAGLQEFQGVAMARQLCYVAFT